MSNCYSDEYILRLSVNMQCLEQSMGRSILDDEALARSVDCLTDRERSALIFHSLRKGYLAMMDTMSVKSLKTFYNLSNDVIYILAVYVTYHNQSNIDTDLSLIKDPKLRYIARCIYGRNMRRADMMHHLGIGNNGMNKLLSSLLSILSSDDRLVHLLNCLLSFSKPLARKVKK